jgi:hypothetical protein
MTHTPDIRAVCARSESATGAIETTCVGTKSAARSGQRSSTSKRRAVFVRRAGDATQPPERQQAGRQPRLSAHRPS